VIKYKKKTIAKSFARATVIEAMVYIFKQNKIMLFSREKKQILASFIYRFTLLLKNLI